jgi:CubicO group peptidase (beta-lactamase class C family)
MKKIILTIIIVITIAVFAGSGLSPRYVMSAPGVGTGIGAKLLCSARYVSGFSEQQAFEDLIQYSPILEYLRVTYDDERRSVRASLFGLSPSTASYAPGIGCYNEYRGFDHRQDLEARSLPVFTSRWPHGNRVDSINPSIQRQLDTLVALDNAEGLSTRAMLVVHNGQIVAESYAQGAGPDTPLLGWSMAKSLTAVMIGNLEHRGLLTVDDTPGFNAWANDDRAAIQISHMLTMTDGLDFSEQYDPGDDATAMLFTEPSASAYAMRSAAIHAPGAYNNYSSGTANLLARVYFERTGGSLDASLEDFRRHIAVPLSLQHTVFEPDASGVFVGSSYLYASARDWARLGQMMLNRGVLNGHRIVSEDWVQRSVQPNDSTNYRAYGYQWWLNDGDERRSWPDLPADAYAAMGNRQQLVMVVPSADTVIVRLGWTSGGYPTNQRMADILQALN